MIKNLVTILNVVVIQYLITTHYDVPHKWAWLLLTGILLCTLLAYLETSARKKRRR